MTLLLKDAWSIFSYWFCLSRSRHHSYFGCPLWLRPLSLGSSTTAAGGERLEHVFSSFSHRRNFLIFSHLSLSLSYVCLPLTHSLTCNFIILFSDWTRLTFVKSQSNRRIWHATVFRCFRVRRPWGVALPPLPSSPRAWQLLLFKLQQYPHAWEEVFHGCWS